MEIKKSEKGDSHATIIRSVISSHGGLDGAMVGLAKKQ